MEENKFDFSKVSSNKRITKEDIFDSGCDQVAIFEKYFGQNINFKKSYTNRLRVDKTPGCKFRYRKGILYLYDYSQSKSYDIIQWVMDDYGITYPEALNKIFDDFNLNNFVKVPRVELPYDETSESELKIQIVPKTYSKEFINYYKQYHINEDICNEEDVYCVSELFFNGEKYYLSDKELCIAYYFRDIDKLKILRPNQPKQSKWRTNVPNTYIDGLSELDYSINYVIIVKSKKDKMLLKSLGYKNILSVQMEGTFVINEETEEILKNFRKFIWMDADKTGKMVSKHYEEKGYNPLGLEDFYYDVFEITDPTDYVKIFNETSKIKQVIDDKINKN